MSHVGCTQAASGALTCAFDLPENRKVGGSTPPLATTEAAGLQMPTCGFCNSPLNPGEPYPIAGRSQGTNTPKFQIFARKRKNRSNY
jgi:hypothetical protein